MRTVFLSIEILAKEIPSMSYQNKEYTLNNMKVYYIGMGYKSCYYVRCLQPQIYNGWNGEQRSLRTSLVSKQQMFKDAMQSDVIVFHRPMDSKMFEAAKLLKQAGKKIVMDNDDTYRKDSGVPTQMFGRLDAELKKAVESIDTLLKRFASVADMVTVSTEFLADEYRDVNKNVVVLPNCIDPMDWDKPKRNDTDTVRIGIVGSVASNKDYEQIKPLLDILKDNPKVKIVLFALPPKKPDTEWVTDIYKPEFDFWNQYNVEWTPFCQIEDYMRTLNNLKLDIMLIPRHDNYFNRAKSNVKFLEASILAIPTVAQSFSDGLSPYEVNEADKDNLILCKTEQDWIDKTLELVENKDMRRALGDKARDYVITNYNIKANAHKWADAYKSLWNESK
jgi:glycosyltransferase involved in cell wall biosynthesis